MLILESLGKQFDGRAAVDRVTLRVARGQMLGVIGRSGAGKSTLLRMINRLVDPTSGLIRHDDRLVSALKGRELMRWRAACAMIFQQFNLVGRLDVVTNVMLGRLNRHGFLGSMAGAFSAAERAVALQALDRLGIAQTALQRAETLSGGQQQRVAIARALLQEPEILLADEPIASLDPRSSKLVMDALRRINRDDKITVIVNLHDLDIARAYCDRIVGLANGSVVFNGAPEDLDSQALETIYGHDVETGSLLDEPRRPTDFRVWAAA
ncbi:phosphonate transport system ATP-binding protein [Arboricoccus pini]|uniref:Phosphonate transport system ATP-binding protein n=1 Tax=Arboricoccus pini TaxID=1963835 RepID=A0A212RZC9_9PROT|nr:phosphonate ABC transporter ATP-binding protein [Arboricoccus pini]SNB78203.1 phosphonate transport system ATP-binding protein [Arboricoccus pini]